LRADVLLDAGRRSLLQQRLGAAAWCYELGGLPHSAYGWERFTTMLAWAYWPDRTSSYRRASHAGAPPGREAHQATVRYSASY
jgi:hypothetical protein